MKVFYLSKVPFPDDHGLKNETNIILLARKKGAVVTILCIDHGVLLLPPI